MQQTLRDDLDQRFDEEENREHDVDHIQSLLDDAFGVVERIVDSQCDGAENDEHEYNIVKVVVPRLDMAMLTAPHMLNKILCTLLG